MYCLDEDQEEEDYPRCREAYQEYENGGMIMVEENVMGGGGILMF